MPNWPQIAERIRSHTGNRGELDDVLAVGGGCINTAHRLTLGGTRYFVKTNDAQALDMFDAERDGLAELQASHGIRVPTPLLTGVDGGTAFLVMEYLDLGGAADGARLGEGLAALHHHDWTEQGQPRFGWWRDNTIGATPQINTPADQWARFWAQHRLGFQLELAVQRGAHSLLDRGQRLLEALPALFSDYRPAASLLHGDLWSGNYAYLAGGEPVIFDPAVYYGDREADLAMTELFGGFPNEFYAAYRAAYPLDPGYPLRKVLYNLYHVLNHYNLFGGGYLAQASGMVDRLLGEL